MTDIWNAVVMLVLLTSDVISSPVPTAVQTGGENGLHQQRRANNIVPNLSVGISSLAREVDGHIEERQLEISWSSIDYLEGDQLILYQYVSENTFCQPSGSAVVEQVVIDAVTSSASWIRLNTWMPHLQAGDLIDERCQYFWVAYVRQSGQIVECNCLRARPNWMSDLKETIKNVKLRELFLPGTHDAAAYERYTGGLGSDNMATKYAITQDEDLFHQLSFGVRYLDMRILFQQNSQTSFWTHHGAYILRPLVNDTALVREFLSRTDEIVIFDIHGVDNFSEQAHQQLYQLLYDEFGPWMAPNNLTWDAILDDFWSTGKRLVVTYNDEANQIGFPLLWPAVQHQWGNVNTVQDLETYLSGVMEEAAGFTFPWSSMAELTPNSADVMTDRLDGLRGAADLVNQDCWATSLYPAEELRVFLTLSPLAKSMSGGDIQQRQIELNWHGNQATSQQNDWIGLYEHDPTNNPTLPLRQISAQGLNTGYHKTDILFGFPTIDRQLSAGDSCLGYWIGYIRNGVTIATNCLKIRPTWMWQNRHVIGSVPLHRLFLPGTHNSGSYRPYNGHSSDTLFMRYLICQDEDIFHQLAYGIRYLDIRVGYYADKEEKFWLNHNYARVNPLRFLIEDLTQFLQATREVVILDFHRFPVGFSQNTQRNRETHAQLVQLLLDKLGHFMVPNSIGSAASLNELWAINRTLIVVYADDWTRSSHPFLWPSVPQEWGDKRNVNDLYWYLARIDNKRIGSDYFWAAMAELTPSTMDVLFRPHDGLRKLADAVARNVTAWYRDLWWKTSSAVAVDFFHSTDIVDVAIDASLKRVQCASPILTSIIPSSTAAMEQLQSVADERSSTDRRRFYQGPRSLELIETTSESVVSSVSTSSTTDTTPSKSTKLMATRRRRPKNSTMTITPSNLPVTSSLS